MRTCDFLTRFQNVRRMTGVDATPRLIDEPSLPGMEIEVPTLCDGVVQTVRTRLKALMETVKQRRRKQ